MKPTSKIVLNLMFLVSTIVLIFIFTKYFATHTTYELDIFFSVGVLAILFIFKNKLHSLLGAFLLMTTILMNAAGLLGAYNISFYDIGWDKYMHIIGSSGIFLLIITYLEHRFRGDNHNQNISKNGISKSQIYVFALAISITIGTLNEINEFIGSEMFGKTQGIFAVDNGTVYSTFDRFDGYWDLLFNTLSILVTALLYRIITSIYRKIKK